MMRNVPSPMASPVRLCCVRNSILFRCRSRRMERCVPPCGTKIRKTGDPPQVRDYNDVTIRLSDRYIISNNLSQDTNSFRNWQIKQPIGKTGRRKYKIPQWAYYYYKIRKEERGKRKEGIDISHLDTLMFYPVYDKPFSEKRTWVDFDTQSY